MADDRFHLDSDDSDDESASAPTTNIDSIPDGPTFHLVTMNDGSRFSSVSPLKIHRWIKKSIGDVESAKPLRSGALLIRVLSKGQALSLHDLKDFLGKEVTVRPADRLNSVEALAYAPSLLGIDDQELLTELKDQGVVGVQRLRPREGKPSPLIRFRFRGNSHPVSIRAGYEIFHLRLWIRPPVLCRKCARYGHGARSCRAKTARCLQCSGAHATDGCEAAHRRCPHCDGPHAAWERDCPAMQEHLYQTEQEQRANAGPPTPPPYSTYAEVITQPRRVRPRRPPPQPPLGGRRDEVPQITISTQTDPVPNRSEVSCQTADAPAAMSMSTQTDPPPATTTQANSTDEVPQITISTQTDPVPNRSEVSCQTADAPAAMSMSTQTDPSPATTTQANSTEPDPRDDASKTSDRTPVAAYHRVRTDNSPQPVLYQSSARFRYTRPITRAFSQQQSVPATMASSQQQSVPGQFTPRPQYRPCWKQSHDWW